MRFSEQWLRTWVNPPCDSEALGMALTMAGLELDQLMPAAPTLEGVRVAKVVELAQHPTAPRLKICQIEAGDAQTVQVVCGAPNVKQGGCYPYAVPGVTLPGGQQIEDAKIRDVASAGMLCSAAELGLEEHSAGLLELGAEVTVGEAITEALKLEDTVFEIDLTPNRADCLSILGVAREVAAVYDLQLESLSPQPQASIKAVHDEQMSVDLLAEKACPKYLGCVIKQVDAKAVAPLWLRERLRRSGQRSINVVVDVLNYVMLELGQPMHAFDLARLHGGIQVRWGNPQDQLLLLDGQTIEDLQDTLVIADQQQAVAVAGVMGGLESAVTEETHDVFLECAYFDPVAIAGKARALGLHTESSHRYERGVDPQLQHRAMNRAIELIQQFAGGEVGPIQEHLLKDYLPVPGAVQLSCDQVRDALGVALTDEQILSCIKRLGGDLVPQKEGWLVTAPSHRFDMHEPVDLIEEVARLYGYDEIISLPIPMNRVQLETNDHAGIETTVTDLMASLGYHEAVGFSFGDPEKNRLCDFHGVAKPLSNPISSELSVMRTSLWPGLCQMLAYNLNRQQEDIRLFEVGAKFLPADGLVNEVPVLAGIACGQRMPAYWGGAGDPLSFYDVKGDVEWLLSVLGVRGWEIESQRVEGLHPGQSAVLLKDGQELGKIGVLHPQVAMQFGLEREKPIVFEVLLDCLPSATTVTDFAMWSRYPAVKRDIALEVDENLPVAQLLSLLKAQSIPQLIAIEVFDLYQGKGVPEGRKSVALGLILQEFSRTLRDKEIEQIVNQLVTLAAQHFGAKLRNA